MFDLPGKCRVMWGLRGLLWLCCVALLVFGGACKDKPCANDSECQSGEYCQLPLGACTSDCKGDLDCPGNEECDNGRCRTRASACSTKSSKRCVGDSLYWFDSCDNQEELIEDCGNKGCVDNKCNDKANTCPNGTCDTGTEDCSTCPQDCACQPGESCDAGQCKADSLCGNGTCDTGEDCSSCAKDCSCASGELCVSGTCNASKECGNGKCEPDKQENCASCGRDCPCSTGQVCEGSSGTCRAACGDGTCDIGAGENCTSCAQDCACQKGQACTQGRCETSCGNGKCDTAYGEDCSNCPKDCACPSGKECNAGSCGKDCGNNSCQADQGEDCSTCAKDCACKGDQVCNTGQCVDRCGNGVCDQDKGENCSTCAKDCACPTGLSCGSGTCQTPCGDGTCQADKGENCTTCAKDCACEGGKSCVGGSCSCQLNCDGKSCGDDGCGGSCGTCSGRTTCNAGKCECKHECDKQGESSCLGTTKYQRCDLDSQGCRVNKSFSCLGGRECQNGSCCSSSCAGKQCGDDGCGGSCGSCSARASCNGGKCECKHECSKAGETKCDGTKGYLECLVEASSQCRYWSATRTCANGASCLNNRCCQPTCSGKECGGDGCGGLCGNCSFGCTNNTCRRTLITLSVEFPCGLCNDSGAIGSYAKPDPYIKLSLSNGQSYKSGEKGNTCGATLVYNWSVTNLDGNALKNAKLEILDADPLNADDLCVQLSADLSIAGPRTLSATKSGKTVKFNIEVKK